MNLMAIAPSPTAVDTRFVDLARTSPVANTRLTLVSRIRHPISRPAEWPTDLVDLEVGAGQEVTGRIELIMIPVRPLRAWLTADAHKHRLGVQTAFRHAASRASRAQPPPAPHTTAA